MDAGEDLDQGGLARAVLADEAMRLAGEQFDRAVLERVDGSKALGGVLESKHGLTIR